MLVGGAAAISAGQRRRLLLARALVSSFPIVLLDEPTEHLDADDGGRMLTELLTPTRCFPPIAPSWSRAITCLISIDCPIVALSDGKYPHRA